MKTKRNFDIYLILTIIYCVCIFMTMLEKNRLDNDNYFMIAHARYIIENGFPTIEPFSIHSGFDFMVPQWLTAMVIYFINNYLGSRYVYVLFYIVLFITEFVLYKLLVYISDNKLMSAFLTGLAMSLVSAVSFATRPFMITLLISIIELYSLEVYRKERNSKAIYIIPVLSILLINFHNSLWPIIFILIMPYIAEYMIHLILKEDTFQIKPLILMSILAFVAGFINPYGKTAILYIFKSMKSIAPMNNYIEELKPANLSNGFFIFLIILLIFLIIVLEKKKNIVVSHLFLLLGTGFMTLMSIRNQIFFIPIATLFAIDNLKDIRVNIKKINIDNYIRKLTIVMIITVFLVPFCQKPEKDFYAYSYSAIEWLEKNYSASEIKLFNHINDGPYLIYKGFKPYIDTRLEVYGITNNKKEDIITEYLKVMDGSLYFEDFNKKYGFDTFIINKELQPYIYQQLKHNEKYNKVYEDDNSVIYVLNKLLT